MLKKAGKGMFKKKLVTLGLVAVVSVSNLCSCSSETTPEPTQLISVESGTDENESESSTEDDTMGQANIGKFDPEDVCKNISINGEIVEFP